MTCRTKFETHAQGRALSKQKLILFGTAWKRLEDNVELYTIAEFDDLMSSLGDDIYSPKMALFY